MLVGPQTGDIQAAISVASYFLEGFFLSNAIAAHKHRTRLHVLRDRLKRALRDQKRGLTGAAERVKLHQANRQAYRAAHP
jgi:hypothetical protein